MTPREIELNNVLSQKRATEETVLPTRFGCRIATLDINPKLKVAAQSGRAPIRCVSQTLNAHAKLLCVTWSQHRVCCTGVDHHPKGRIVVGREIDEDSIGLITSEEWDLSNDSV